MKFASRRTYATPVLPLMMVQATLHDIEGVAQRYVDIGVCRVITALAMHFDFRSRQAESDLDVERCATVTVSRWCFDDHLTTCDALVESLEALNVLAHACFHRRGWLQVTECDSHWGLHDRVS
jgi:hypothetical protein